MAWEWVAPAATLCSGVAGMWFTYKTGRNQAANQFKQLVQQQEHALRVEEINKKRQLYADYVGMLMEASYTAVMVAAARRLSRSSSFADLSPSMQAKLTDLVLEVMPDEPVGGYSREELFNMLLHRAVHFRNEATAKESKSIVNENPFISINFNELLSLSVQVEMVAEPEVARLARPAITTIINVSTGREELSSERPIRRSIDVLKEAMQRELSGRSVDDPRG